MDRSSCDVLIIGTGIGGAAIANRMLSVGAKVSMLPGAGRPRFTHLDGGIIQPTVLERAFGTLEGAPITQIGDEYVFQRDELERWALGTLGDRVTFRENFEEARIDPRDTGQLTITDASGEQTILSSSVILTEGANPKIGIAARIRPDFDPEDMIHFGRTFLKDVKVPNATTGSWRTSWNMPAWYTIVPQVDGVFVSGSARIENLMRASRDGREVLQDFLASDLAHELGVSSSAGEMGMELVPLSNSRHASTIGAHNIMISFDANGTIDPRSLQRYNGTLTAASELGAMMVREWPDLVEWDDVGSSIWDVFSTARSPYHDDSETGFIEDGAGPRRGLMDRLFKR